MSTTVFGIEVDDKVSPSLQKIREEMDELSLASIKLKSKISDIDSNKKVYLDATKIHESNEAIRKLQYELGELYDKQAKASVIARKQHEIEALLKQDRAEAKRKLEALNVEKKIAITTEKKLIAETEKARISQNKEIVALEHSTTSRKKENAVRRSAGTAIVRHIRQLESIAVAYYTVKTAMDALVTQGIHLNKTIEDGQVGIAALISANTEGGTDIERFNASLQTSSEVIKQLKTASVETAATFTQLTEVYQQAIGDALSAGVSMGSSLDDISEKTITISKQMTNVAAAIGMPMVQVNQEIRALLEGTIDKNARISTMLHITNKDIKTAKESANGLYDYIQTKLKAFEALSDEETLGRLTARFTDSLDSIRIEATKPIFDDLKLELVDVTKYIKNNSDAWVEKYQDFYYSIKQLFSNFGEIFSPISDSFSTLFSLFEYSKKRTIEYGDTFKSVIATISGYLSILSDSIKNVTILLKISANGIEMAFSPIASFLEKVIARIKTSINGWKMMYDIFDTGGDNISKLDEENKRLEKIINAPLKLNEDKIKRLNETNKILASQVLTLSEIADNADEKMKKVFNSLSNPVDYKALGQFKNFKLNDSTDVIDIKGQTESVMAYYDVLKKSAKGNADYLVKLEKEKDDTLYRLSNKFATNFTKLELMKADKTKEISEKELRERRKLLKLEQQAYSQYISIVGTEEQKFQDKLAQQMSKLGESGTLTAEQLYKAFDVLNAEHRINIAVEEINVDDLGLDAINDKFLTLYDIIKDVFNDEQIKKFYKTWNGLTDKSEKKSEEANKKQINNVATLGEFYTTATGLMSSFYDEDDKRKKQQAEVDRALNIVKQTARLADLAMVLSTETTKQTIYGTTALASALTAPFPSNIVAYATVASMLASLGIAVGGLGGGGSSIDYKQQRVDNYKQKADDFVEANKPVTDRLDRQIQLLEKISELKGTYGDVLALSIKEALSDYKIKSVEMATKDLGLVGNTIYDINHKRETGAGLVDIKTSAGRNGTLYSKGAINPLTKYSETGYIQTKKMLKQDIKDIADTYRNRYSDAIAVTTAGGYSPFTNDTEYKVNATLNEDYLSKGSNLISFLQELNKYDELELFGVTPDEYKNIMNDAQDATADFVNATLDGLLSLVDTSKDFKSYVDAINGDDKYKKADLRDAYIKVGGLYTEDDNAENFANYLSNTISQIQLLEDNLSSDDILLLRSQKSEDIVAQAKLARTFNEDLSEAIKSGAIEAINYKDQIALVSEAYASSRENIKSWEDSFKTPERLLQEQAKSLDVTYATTGEDLSSLFETLKGGIGGLTDAELELLNANKEYLESIGEITSAIEDNINKQSQLATIYKYTHTALEGVIYDRSKELETMGQEDAVRQQYIYALEDARDAYKDIYDQYNDIIKDTENSISTLSDVVRRLDTTITALRNSASNDTSYSLELFKASMAESKALSSGTDYKAFSDSVSRTVGYSKVLEDASNFYSKQDQQFAQLVAANQFEDLQDTSITQIDYLKKIEVNTRLQIEALVESMNNLGMGIELSNQQNDADIQALIASLKSQTLATKDALDAATANYKAQSKVPVVQQQPVESAIVHKIYDDLDYNQYQTDNSGYDYWTTQLQTGALTTDNVADTIQTAGIEWKEDNNVPLTSNELVHSIYDDLGYDQYQTDNSGYDYWTSQLESGALTEDNIAETIQTAGEEWKELHGYAVGTPSVPFDMVAQIHQGEMIVPKTFNDGVKSGEISIGSNKELVRLVKELVESDKRKEQRLAKLQDDNYKMRRMLERQEIDGIKVAS